MDIYDDRWNEFVKIAEEMRGTASVDLRPEGTRWDSFVCYLEFGWHFVQFIVLMFLCIVNFYLWSDVITYFLT